jgi:hypothetical protein
MPLPKKPHLGFVTGEVEVVNPIVLGSLIVKPPTVAEAIAAGWWQRSAALAAPVFSLSISAVPCVLKAAYGYLTAGTRFLMLFDKAAAPVLGDVPFLPPVRVVANGTGFFDFGDGVLFPLGCQIAFSQTDVTYTQPGAAAGTFAGFFKP